jgi:hypothetical protein
MYTGRAFIIGIVATAIVSGIILILRMAGLPLDILTRLGALLGMNTWIAGFVVYLLIGGVVALAYAAIFEWVLHQAGVGAGVLLGACNTILAGFIWATGSNPGKFWHYFGVAGTAALFLVHFAYGAVVGGLYRTKHTLEYR